MHIALHIVVIIMRTIILGIHSIGIYVIFSLCRQGRNSSQRLYLLHICVSRGLFNLLWTMINYLEFIAPSFAQKSRPYIVIASFLGLNLVWYLDMVWMTIDRLAKFLLKLNYVQYWNERKTKKLLTATWCIGGICFGSASLVYVFGSNVPKTHWKKYIVEVLHLPMDAVFIVITTTAHCLIKKKVEVRPLVFIFLDWFSRTT